MKYFIWLFTIITLVFADNIVLAQSSGYDWNAGSDPESYFGDRTDVFVRYCHQELFPRFEKRRYGLTPLFGQANSFELWADSLNRRYLVSVDIAERNWEITQQKSIPLFYKKYVDEYNLEAFVEIFYRGMAKPILAKKYQIVINGKTSYQLLKSEPDYYKLYVPFKQRRDIENRALKTLAARVSSDLYKLIN